MLEKRCTASSGHLFSSKHNIFSQKCFVVTSSLCGDVSVPQFSCGYTNIIPPKFSVLNSKPEWPGSSKHVSKQMQCHIKHF